MLSLRFIGIVFEEMRNLLLGLAARGVPWKELRLAGTVQVLATLVARIFGNLLAHTSNITLALTARGVTNPAEHELFLERPFPSHPVANTTAVAALGAFLWAASRL